MRELGLSEHPLYPFKFTVPTIYDPNTKRVVNDSEAIAQYLEEQYPDTSKLFPSGTRALQAAFVATNAQTIILPILAICVSFAGKAIAEHDREYYYESRKLIFGGRSVDEAVPKGDALVETVKAFDAALGELAQWLDANESNEFFGGSVPIHADTVIAATLLWIIKVVPETHAVRVALKDAQGGRWVRYLGAFAKWTKNSDQ